MTPTFFDTNVLVYLFDADAAAKQATARELFAEAANNGEFLISTQVLQEFYVVTTTRASPGKTARRTSGASARW